MNTVPSSIAVLSHDMLDGDALVYLARQQLGSRARVRQLDTHAPNATGATVVLLYLDGHSEIAWPQLVRTLASDGAHVIAISGHADDARVTAAYFAGATAFYDLRRNVDGLWDTVRDLLDSRSTGRSPAGIQWAQALDVDAVALTRRERDVMELLSDDPHRPATEIAATLGMSVHTMRSHLANVRNKLGGAAAPNTMALVTAVRDRGWLD